MVLRPQLFLLATWIWKGVFFKKDTIILWTNTLGLIESKENYKKTNFCNTRESLSILMPFSTFSQSPFSWSGSTQAYIALEWKVVCLYFEVFVSQLQAWPLPSRVDSLPFLAVVLVTNIVLLFYCFPWLSFALNIYVLSLLLLSTTQCKWGY